MEDVVDNIGNITENAYLQNENRTFTSVMTASNVNSTSHGAVCVIFKNLILFKKVKYNSLYLDS